MSAVLAPERTLCSVVGRDEFGASLPVCEQRRTERDVRERLQDLERQMRRCEAELVAMLAEADRTGSFRLDGHRTLRQWAGASARWSDVELRDRVRTVRLARDVPEVLDELRAGRLGIAQTREIARLRANPRCGDQVIEAASKLIEHAENEPFFEFRVISRRWESMRDEDGAHKSHEAAHAGVASAQHSSTRRSISSPSGVSPRERRSARSSSASNAPSSTPNGPTCGPGSGTTRRRRCWSAPPPSGGPTRSTRSFSLRHRHRPMRSVRNRS